MDKSFLDIAGFAPLLNRFLRQKSSLRFGEKCKKGGSTRKPISGFTVFKGSGRQYCMQSIPLAVLKLKPLESPHILRLLHAIHTACGIFLFFGAFFSNGRFFYGIMELSKKIFPGRDSDVCHLYDVGGNESD